ncbi:MAG TPA: nucleotidyl transferase AbiEii/AbiGii toxin family protein [Candidatus Binatia bacterium]|nr:nucleotidyl transferase AbiEii/AbiGii toxin family protein [Candidatus Binatia bacterium]
MEQQFAPALEQLCKLIETASRELKMPINFALIGGLAVSAWGISRATQDIDFLADSDPSPLIERRLRDSLKNILDKHGCHAVWRMGGLDDPIPLLLRIEMTHSYPELSADILWVHKRWQRAALRRSIEVNVMGRRIDVLHPEDLIVMKLDAGGPQDLLDVQSLLSSRSRKISLGRLKAAAARLKLSTLLETCLKELSGARKSGLHRNRK